MLAFIGKAFVPYWTIEVGASYVRYIKTKTIPFSNSTEKISLTVSYLTGSCGLSLDKAISASRLVNIRNTEKPDSVLRFLHSQGFAKHDIVTLISKQPRFLVASLEKTLRPKIEFFQSLGMGGEDLTKIFCANDRILKSSLENQIIPFIDFLKGIVGTNENVVITLRHSSRVFNAQFVKVMMPNISNLREQGVPEGHIRRLMMCYPRSLMFRVDLFEEAVNEVKAMGFDPARKSFVWAVRTKTCMSKANWEKKKELLLSYGWSEGEFQSAFVLQPNLMATSDRKIMKVMDFLLTVVGLNPVDVAVYPNIFLCSLEGRLIPRWSLLKILMSEGLIKHADLGCAFIVNNNYFEKKYVIESEKNAPEIIKAYQDGTGFKGLVADCKT
ncbi:hypothetical protein SLE2022_194790 [Rubroshorea leprosula]